MIQAVIFDLDGVLTRSDHYHTAAWREVCSKYGLPFDQTTAELLRGVSRLNSARIVADRGNANMSEEALLKFAEEKNRCYVRLLDTMTQADVCPGVEPLLTLLQKKKIRTAVASSSKNAMRILRQTGLEKYFSVVIDGNQIARSKPDPEVFQRAADTLGIPYENCLVVEDAASGVQAARTLGCQVAAVGAAAAEPGVTYAFNETGSLMDLFRENLMPHLRISPRPVARNENVIQGRTCRVTLLTNRLFRIEQGAVTDEATQAVWYRDLPPVDFQWDWSEGILRIETGALTISIDETNLADSMVIFADGGCARLDNAQNLLGTCSTLDTNGSHLRENPAVSQYDRAHIPLDMGVCARNGVAVYDDSKSLLLHPNGKLTARSGGTDLYAFAYGHDYKAAVQALYRLCGGAPVVPRWALGNWWCRYWPYTQQEYLNLMDNFADDHIPISVAVIDMDWHYVHLEEDFGVREKGLDDAAHGGADGWTGYTWNEKLFPDHVALLKELHDCGMHTALNLHPALGVRWYEKPYRSMAERMGMDPEEKKVVSFQIENETFVNHYLNILHHPLEDEGVDFWWIDWQQGKESGLAGLDPLWALNHYHYLDSVHRRGEGLILSRYAGVGSHRYPVGFSGDIHMDWEFLDYMPYFTATAANVGYGWWSHDIGGHHRGLRDEELYLRWLQFGVFSPINRIHCCPAEVTSKEPWTLSAPMRAMAEKWFRFRHKLVPYLYSASWKNAADGTPLIRPMYYEWPEEDAAYDADHQYLFGDLIVAPITKKSAGLGIAEKQVWLPEGVWTDLFTDRRYMGGRWITVYRDSGVMPVFAGEGTILPLHAKVNNACDVPDELDVYVYAGDGIYELAEEEGCAVQFSVTRNGETQHVFFIQNLTRRRKFHVFFKNIKEGRVGFRVNGKVKAPILRQNRCLQAICQLEAGERAEWIVDAPPVEEEDALRAEILRCFIQLPQDNWYKEKQWERTADIRTAGAWMTWIHALELPEIGKKMLAESIAARRGND